MARLKAGGTGRAERQELEDSLVARLTDMGDRKAEGQGTDPSPMARLTARTEGAEGQRVERKSSDQGFWPEGLAWPDARR